MGTRHLIEVKVGGEIKVAQYGQWDGYLSGQGVEIARFLHSGYVPTQFTAQLNKCRFVTDADKEMFDWLNEDGNDWQRITPHLSRDAGAMILWLVYGSRGLILKDNRGFKDDSCCEYHYLIDLDKNTVTINSVAIVPIPEFTVELCKSEEEEVFKRYEAVLVPKGEGDAKP